MPITVASPINDISTTGSFINISKKFIAYSNVVFNHLIIKVTLTKYRVVFCDVDQYFNLNKISPNLSVIGLMNLLANEYMSNINNAVERVFYFLSLFVL